MKALQWLARVGLAGAVGLLTGSIVAADQPGPAAVDPNIAATPAVVTPATPATPATPTAPAAGAVDPDAAQAFLKKADQQLERAAPPAPAPPTPTPAAEPPPPALPAKPEVAPAPNQKELDKAAHQLADQFKKMQTTILGSRHPRGAKNYFNSQWDLLRMLPEYAYLGTAARAKLAAEDKELATYLRYNKKGIDRIAELAARFHQKLGLEDIHIDVPKRMTNTNPMATKISVDIGLSDDGRQQDISLELTNTDRIMIANLESYLKRLAMSEPRGDYTSAERDWQGVSDNLGGAYYYQLLIQQDPRYGLAYPLTLKFLRTMRHGKVTIPADEPAAKTGGK